MCGLVGAHRQPLRPGPALAAIAHRGPDSQGWAVVGPATLGVRVNRRQPTWQSPDLPAPTIKTEVRDRGQSRAPHGGAGNVIVDDRPERPRMTGKPVYRVPTMEEINKIPWNGYTVASTFSGCGGSSLGYRMAGYRVLYASEFIPAAQDTYRANAAAYTYLDTRDIRAVTADDLMAKAGISRGELDLLDGSPPCASFSTSGKRQDGWGKVKKYSDSAQRTDDLFYEFARVLAGVQPRVFVAENVSGLVKGTAKGYFIRIMQRLRECGYTVEAKVLDAQWLGVPQARQRLIFVGVRNDLARKPVFPAPLSYRYAVREVLPHVIAQGANAEYGNAALRPATRPSGTIGASPATGNGLCPPSTAVVGIRTEYGPNNVRELSAGELSPTVMAHGIGGVREYQAGVRYVHDTSGSRSVGDFTDRPAPTVTVGGEQSNACHYRAVESPALLTHDPETGKDLRIAAAKYAGAGPGTIARKFTLGELRRICAFPDDFVLTGTYEQRWERLGRAVPPVMMAAIATAVRTRILDTLKERP